MASWVGAICLVILVALSASEIKAKKGYGAGEQDWGHVSVRKGARMFYWLYYTTADVSQPTERPLVIWMHGGPGVSATGPGNFEVLGPIDENGNKRNYTWVNEVNVLYIDSPVGTGYSYVDSNDKLPTVNAQAARDLVNFMVEFYKLHPAFQTAPLHIFSQSYDTKIAAEFALQLHKAIKEEKLKSNFKSVVLASTFISPKDTILSYAPYLFYTSLIDHDQYIKIDDLAKSTVRYIDSDNPTRALDYINRTRTEIFQAARQLNEFNILKAPVNDSIAEIAVDGLMNGPVAKALELDQKWSYFNESVFNALLEDQLRSVLHVVTGLLRDTPVQVNVVAGQLDFVCNAAGSVKWIEKIHWEGKRDYKRAPRNGIEIDGRLEGYEKSGGNLQMFWVNRAGHVIPKENPVAMTYILRKITNL